MTKPSIEEHDLTTRAPVSGWQGLVLLLPAVLANPLYASVLADAH